MVHVRRHSVSCGKHNENIGNCGCNDGTLGGLRTHLSDLGEVDLDKLCRDCAAHPLMNNNPVRLDEAALRRMFEALR